jgi:hypothetical protein
MAGEETTNQGNVKQEYSLGRTGLNLDSTVNQIEKGSLSYALNASVENFDGNTINYQNEPGNEHCLDFPVSYQLIGEHSIYEKNKHIFFLASPETGGSEIGYMNNNDCVYHTLVNADCLNFNINHPIHKAVHKITNCATEIYWTDGFNPRRYLDIDNIPYTKSNLSSGCDIIYTNELDCNQLSIQPNFTIPQLEVTDIVTGGSNLAGTVQFAIQYSDVAGNGYTSYYSVTNPTPIADPSITTPNFNYEVGKSVVLTISNLDMSGQFQYYNLAVIKTINNIPSVELVGTYFIDRVEETITYTGQNTTQIRLTTNDIFEKFPYYEIAEDITSVQDILVWNGLTSIDRVNYQQIANQITLQWETHRIPNTETYADELNATNLRGYLRDEVYAFEIVFLLANGKQTDGFHIPGRESTINDLTPVYPTNADFIGEPDSFTGTSPYWKIYNTGSLTGFSPDYSQSTDYKGPYQYGEFSYWESVDVYPCNTLVWGDLANTPIRHHKFPDVAVSPIFESAMFTSASAMVMQKDAIFPIGVKLDLTQITSAINNSNLTTEQKSAIAGFKIVRGDRSTNRSIVAKGILRNVGKYEREGTEYYYPNYPYNDISADPFLLNKSNAYIIGGDGDAVTKCLNYIITVTTLSVDGLFTVEYRNCDTNAVVTVSKYLVGDTIITCALSNPKPLITAGTGTVSEYISDTVCNPEPLKGFDTSASQYRQVFNSPETSFGQPFLGDILKLENVIYGAGRAHFVQVRKNAQNRLLSREAQLDAFASSNTIAAITTPYNTSALFAAYQSYLTIYINGITRRNYSWSFNSIASYDYNSPIENNTYDYTGYLGVKQRMLDIAQYLIPGVQSAGDNNNINNWQRESSVYLKTTDKVGRFIRYYTNYIICNTSSSDIEIFKYENIVIGETTISLNAGQCVYVDSFTYPQQILGPSQFIITVVSTSSVTVDSPTPTLVYPDKSPTVVNNLVTDNSRFVNSDPRADCNNPGNHVNINVISYYASLKNIAINQWGQIYSYTTIDTGFQRDITPLTEPVYATVFGGDTFIGQFAFKTKLPFFIDNRVGAPDDSDIYYDEIGNVAYPQYWWSSRSVLSDVTWTGGGGSGVLKNFISIKAHNLDCPNSQTPATAPGRTYYDGKMYQFAYGIPSFYCETSYNVDLRQAFNNREGDFWPHVSTNIPDDWVQESYVSIAQDNTYYYNVTFSKQNKENFFSHLPADWSPEICFTYFPFRAIYSETASDNPDVKVNNWLTYKSIASFDFPQNYGGLISLDGIQNKAVLARFENKSLLYNTMLTINTSNPQAAYMGNDTLFKSSPPIDFAETDLGYVGSQNKMLLKIPQGQITIDAKRGQVFLIAGNQAKDLSVLGSGLNRFFTEHLAFEILKYFPEVDTDNHFTGCGLHGTFDSKYERVIVTKLDYIPKNKNIKYDPITRTYYLSTILSTGQEIRTEVYLTDLDYFCNKSWTLTYSMNTNSWISFHSYIPNWYIAENNFFYSGLNDCCSDLEAIVGVVTHCYLVGNVEELYCNVTGVAYLIDPCAVTGVAYLIEPCEMVGDAVTNGTTTTTTTVNNCLIAGIAIDESPTTTTTTTTAGPDCEIVGIAIDETPTTTTTTTLTPTTTSTTTLFNCEISGIAIDETPTTTTTTTTTSAPITTTTTTTTTLVPECDISGEAFLL